MNKLLFKPKNFFILFLVLVLLIVLSPYIFEPLGNSFKLCSCDNPLYETQNGWMCTVSLNKLPTKYYIGGTYAMNCGESFMEKVRFGLSVVASVYLVAFVIIFLRKKKQQKIQ